jgi:hypothetical protein
MFFYTRLVLLGNQGLMKELKVRLMERMLCADPRYLPPWSLTRLQAQ